MRRFERGKVVFAPADAAQRKIIAPRGGAVEREFLFELHGADGGKRVVYVVHRAEENVGLVVPHPAAAHEFVLRIVGAPGHIFLFQLAPFKRAFTRGEPGVGIADVLEFVHRNAEGDKGHSLLQMAVTVFIGIRAEEAFGIGVAELLHGHGMNLGYVGRFAVIIADGLGAHGFVPGEGVAHFVGEHLGIEGGVVEAGENKRRAVFGQIGHIAGGCLSGAVFQVEKPVLYHKVDKFRRFGGKLFI